jgi:3-isopropylmalate dehydrogenase
MAQHQIAVIAGDGIGPEVIGEALRAVEAVGVELDTVEYDLGSERYLRTGEVLPDSVLEEIRGADAILLGALGAPVGSSEVPSGVLERGILLKLRFTLDLAVNVRPFNGVPGSLAPEADLVVIRENTEGPYAGEGGILKKGTPHEIATQGSVNTRHGVERCVRYAYELAAERSRNQLTMIHKTNVLTYAGDLWQRTFDEVGQGFVGVRTAYQHADAACIYLVTGADQYDVIVTDNLFGDLLTDLAGAVTGGIGLAASANLNLSRDLPSLFEPAHGAAHDICGTDRANPIAAIRSAAMMLDHLGDREQAAVMTAAVLAVQEALSANWEQYRTKEVTDEVIRRF